MGFMGMMVRPAKPSQVGQRDQTATAGPDPLDYQESLYQPGRSVPAGRPVAWSYSVYVQAGWKNASIFWLASGDDSISCMCADFRPAALVRSNISRSYFLTAAGKSSGCAASARPSRAPSSSAMLAPCPTGG